MDDTKKRILGYGSGLLAAGVLSYLGFIQSHSAEVETLVGSAEVQIRLAASIPAIDKHGKPTAARVDLVRRVRQCLDDAEAQRPDYPPARELRAQLLYLEGRYADAAAVYGWLRRCESSTPRQRDVFVLNQSRMLRAAGDAKAAELALNAHGQGFLTENAAKSQIERAHVLMDLGRKSEAVEAMARLAAEAEAPMVLLAAGRFLEAQGQVKAADTAYQKAARTEPLADYYRARLKVRNAEYDIGLDLLERVMRVAGPRVRVLLRQDHKTWTPCRRSKRFSDLLGPVSRPAHPGR